MPRKPKKQVVAGKTRLNLRLPADLDAFAKRYAREMGTTITRIVVEHLRELKDKWERYHGVEQI
jgi:hypothetical protein